MLVASVPKGGRAYVAGCSGARAYIYMCLTISLPSSEVMQNLRGGWFTPAEQMRVNWMHPCGASLTLKAGSGCESPFQFTHAYVCQSEGVMPAATLPPPIQSVLYWQLPTSP